MPILGTMIGCVSPDNKLSGRPFCGPFPDRGGRVGNIRVDQMKPHDIGLRIIQCDVGHVEIDDIVQQLSKALKQLGKSALRRQGLCQFQQG